MKIFGKRVKELREERGISMGELARHIGTSQQNVSRWESGEVMPGGDALLKLSKFFNVSIDYLMGLSDE